MTQQSRTKRSTRLGTKGGALCDSSLDKQISVRLSLKEYEEIVAAARSEGRTVSNYLRRLLIVIERKAS